MATKLAFTKVIEFRADDITISFVPTKGAPGYSHYVLILRGNTRMLVARDWLSDSSAVTEKAAQYFYEKHQVALSSVM